MIMYELENTPIEFGSVGLVANTNKNIIIATGTMIIIASISMATNLWTISACSILCPICCGG